MKPDLFYQLALTMVPHIGPVQAKILLQHCEAEEIFNAKKSFLEKIEGIGPVRADAIKRFKKFSSVEDEITFIEKYSIKPLFITDNEYPQRLLNCVDSPILLFYKGKANLNSTKVMAIIGTRSHTEYARQVTEKLVDELSIHGVTIISGLAFGVDAIAHKTALKNNLPTIGVLAHGLDKIYPYEHTSLAKEIISNQGGLLSEFKSGGKPDRHNFPQRNRIVAGMCDAVIVIETDIRGGSMITADLANGYNRDIFAVPGRITDMKSSGCNNLIKSNKAILYTSAADLLDMMGWQEIKNVPKKKQKELFIELSPEEKSIISILSGKQSVHIDELNFCSGLSSSKVAASVLNLELNNVILSLPGKMYQLA